MDLRRKISYQWQLFVPLTLTLWVVIIGMGYLQFHNEAELRREKIREQLDLVNARVIAAYEKDFNPDDFLDFVARYYIENPLYDKIRISLFTDGVLTKAYGRPITLTDAEKAGDYSGMDATTSDGDYFYRQPHHSADGRIVVCTILPYNKKVSMAATPSARIMYIVIAIGLVVTIVSFFSTRYFGRNIKILRTIAERAASDPNFIPAMDYPHDELGDISRQIIHMYNERSQAMCSLKREHNVAMHAIEEKARAKRQLTNNINHELRTPIGVIKGYLDTILDNPDMDDASRTHFLKKAREHVNRLVNLIADVSAITRLEEGGNIISTEELDFHDTVYTLASDIEESGSLGEMTFSFDVPFDCKIHGNYNLLTGMIINLVKNAAAYSKGTECQLTCTGEDENFYYFLFRDNGTGVGEEHLPHIFERFYRIDSGRSRKAGGTGLGLPIVQNTVLAHGGKITVENCPGGGLGFRFSLPKYKGR